MKNITLDDIKLKELFLRLCKDVADTESNFKAFKIGFNSPVELTKEEK